MRIQLLSIRTPSFPKVYYTRRCTKRHTLFIAHSVHEGHSKNIYIYIFFELLNGFRELKPLDISDFFYSILKIYSILSEHILSFDLSSFMHSKYYSPNHGY